TTIGRMRKERPIPTPPRPEIHAAERHVVSAQHVLSAKRVSAKRPNHLWHVDLTTVPTLWGFWCAWSPAAWPQCWPFCWWLALIVDHYSRRLIGFTLFRQAPTAVALRACLGRAMASAGAVLRYLVSDKGSQYWPALGYRRWCRRRGIRPRFG